MIAGTFDHQHLWKESNHVLDFWIKISAKKNIILSSGHPIDAVKLKIDKKNGRFNYIKKGPRGPVIVSFVLL